METFAPFELVHSDVMGPMSPKPKSGGQYAVTSIDDYTRFVFVYVLKSKSEVFDRFRELLALAKNQSGRQVRRIRRDNGGEYLSKRFNQLCGAEGIVHETKAPYTPQQNGLAERMNRTLAGMARSMIYHMRVDRAWWAEALCTAAYPVNRVPNTV